MHDLRKTDKELDENLETTHSICHLYVRANMKWHRAERRLDRMEQAMEQMQRIISSYRTWVAEVQQSVDTSGCGKYLERESLRIQNMEPPYHHLDYHFCCKKEACVFGKDSAIWNKIQKEKKKAKIQAKVKPLKDLPPIPADLLDPGLIRRQKAQTFVAGLND